MEEMRIKVNTELLKERATTTKCKLKKIQNHFEKMEEIVCHSKHHWEGEANEAYCKAFSEYQIEIDEILKRMTEHITDLEKMAHIYTSTESNIMKLDLPANVLE